MFEPFGVADPEDQTNTLLIPAKVCAIMCLTNAMRITMTIAIPQFDGCGTVSGAGSVVNARLNVQGYCYPKIRVRYYKIQL